MIDSKNYTALSEGWSTSISSIIRDDFVLQDSWSTENINLDDAVSHRTGMPRHDMAWPRYHQDGRKVTTAEAVRLLRHLKPSAPPRTTWQYCNFMFVVLGHVVETLTGQWLGDAIREKIWNPLGMTATFGDTKDAVAATEDLAEGYYWDSEKSAYQKLRLDSTRESSGAGLVISTVTDYSKWVRCLLDQTQPFSKDAHKDIRKTRMLMPAEEKTGPGDITYGLAWMKKTYHGEVVYKHGGTELAYSTQVYWLPGRRYGVVVMANTGYSNSAEDEVVWRLIEDKLGVPEDKRFNLSAK
jgi:CubicO group peptidase (beta-lactamase class C family)